MSFPTAFTWGAAASSYQIEGAAHADGKGLSVWDMFCNRDGAVWEGQDGDVACDHYHRYAGDVALMEEVGLQAYRFSVCWPRVLPEGIGPVNRKGMDFYDRLVDALLDVGIEPWITLFHWDYPYALYCRGGWLNPDSPGWFADYAETVVSKLSDRVTHWITHNEPQVFITMGHQWDQVAPGLELELCQVLLAAHNSLLAHGLAVQSIRAVAPAGTKVGAAPVGIVKIPATDSPEDAEAARAATFAIASDDCWNNTWFADPMILGHYPADGLERFAEQLPQFRDGDMATIAQPLDFYGVNVYGGDLVRALPDGGSEPVPHPRGNGVTSMHWHVVPQALYWGPKFFYERYQLPIVVTENGMANNDWVHIDGRVHDPERIDFLTRYLREYARAIDDGVDASGYFCWSIMDNFEWAHGYRPRFGLIHVDYPTGKRTLKDSAHWYRSVIESNGKGL